METNYESVRVCVAAVSFASSCGIVSLLGYLRWYTRLGYISELSIKRLPVWQSMPHILALLDIEGLCIISTV